jgi:ABC-type glycerol-3-phosphate transport system substrate-binding protein
MSRPVPERVCAPDFEGAQHEAVTAFNRLQPKVKVRLVAFGPKGHEVAGQPRKAGAAGKCDVVMVQDTAVPAMAAAGELRDLSAYDGARGARACAGRSSTKRCRAPMRR